MCLIGRYRRQLIRMTACGKFCVAHHDSIKLSARVKLGARLEASSSHSHLNYHIHSLWLMCANKSWRRRQLLFLFFHQGCKTIEWRQKFFTISSANRSDIEAQGWCSGSKPLRQIQVPHRANEKRQAQNKNASLNTQESRKISGPASIAGVRYRRTRLASRNGNKSFRQSAHYRYVYTALGLRFGELRRRRWEKKAV